MKNTYLEIIREYVEENKTINDIANQLAIEKISLAINKNMINNRCNLSPKDLKEATDELMVEKTEVMLDEMMIMTFPASLRYLNKYLTKLNYETFQGLVELVKTNEKYSIDRKSHLTTKELPTKVNSYYKRKMTTMLGIALENKKIRDEFKFNVFGASEVYNLDPKIVFLCLQSYARSKDVSQNTQDRVTVDNFIKSGLWVEEFCKALGGTMTAPVFNKIIEGDKDLDPQKHKEGFASIDPEKYREAKELIDQEEKAKDIYVVHKAKELIEFINKGIEVNGRIEKFTMLDYYSCVNMSYRDFGIRLSKLGLGDAIREIKSALGNKEIGINGTTYLFQVASKLAIDGKRGTEEQIRGIFDQFEKFDIKPTGGLFQIALKRVINDVPVFPFITSAKPQVEKKPVIKEKRNKRL